MLYYFALKIAGIAMSVFGTNYTVFVIGRFCLGCGHVGYHHPGFVLGKIYNVLLHKFSSRISLAAVTRRGGRRQRRCGYQCTVGRN